jgi:ABC-type transport system involved in multi-copper enzyme maturation permease subunit
MTTPHAVLVTDYASVLPGRPSIVGQTICLLVDAYRELNARKLFWITMIISGLVVAAFSIVGIDADGLKILWFNVYPPFNSSLMAPADFYKFLFARFGIGLWLTWVATILALVSTAGTFPEMLVGGAIELFVSKPISRLRLFLTRYCTGLLFVALQVTVFCVACFILIGVRGHAWEWGIFLAVPMVVLFFSYLFCVCTLFGVLTRSVIAALLLTILFWLLTFAVQSTETIFTLLSLQDQVRVEHVQELQQQIAQFNGQLTDAKAFEAAATRPSAHPATHPAWHAASASSIAMQIKVAQSTLDAELEGGPPSNRFVAWQQGFHDANWFLPKTQQTYQLIERWLAVAARLPRDQQEQENADIRAAERGRSGQFIANRHNERIAAQRVEDLNRQRSPIEILGSSALFEAVVLSLAAWIFCRRDY